MAGVAAACSLALAGCNGMHGFAGGASAFGPGAMSPALPLPNLPGPQPGIIPDTWVGIHAFQVFDSRISPQQAKQDAPRYDMVWGSSEPKPWRSGNSHIITSYYAPFEADFTTQHDLTWWQTNHPDWVLYKCDKKTPAWPDGLKNVPLDISNPAIVQWQMNTYAGVIENGEYGALAADLIALGNADHGCGVWVKGVWVPKFTGQPTDDAWAKAVLAWARYAYDYLHELPRPIVLGANHVPESRPFGDPEEDDLINHIDFVDDESSFTDYGNSYASSAKVALIVQWMAYIQALAKPYIVDDKWNTKTMDNQQLAWSISTYLLGKYHFSSLYTDHLPGYGYEYWYPQYGDQIGSPCGAAVPDPVHTGVYTRKYTQAFVIVNASINKTYSIVLPKPSYTDIFGNTINSPMSLGPDSSDVLLTTNGCK